MGTIIAVEGTDGSGKETQSRRLEKALLERGLPVRRLSFPRYEDEASVFIRRYLGGEYGDRADDVAPAAASLFYALDRYDAFMREFGEFYNDGGILITDRYTTSNMIHQASKIAGADQREKFLTWLEKTEYEQLGIPKPDLVFYLDLPPEVSKMLIDARAEKTGEAEDIHEADPEYLARAAESADGLIRRCGWTKIDCVDAGKLRSIDDIGTELTEKTLAFLETKDDSGGADHVR